MKIDSIYFAVFSLAQLFLFSAPGDRLTHGFLASYNFVVWGVLCGIGFAAYPWLRAFPHVSPRFRFASVFLHLLTIFVFSTAISFVALGSVAADHFAEWQLGLFFVAVPSALAGAIALLFSYAAFCFTRHA